MQDWLLLQIQISIVILIIIILRLLMRRLPKIYSYALWLVVFLRLMIPWNIESPVSVVPSGDSLESFFKLQTAETTGPLSHSDFAPMPGNVTANPESSSDELSQTHDISAARPETANPPAQILPGRETFPAAFTRLQTALVILWATGFLGICLYNLLSLRKIRRVLKDATLLEDNVWTSAGIPTAFVLGWRRPQIYLPASLGGAEMEYILCHEKIHIRRKDYLFKNAAFLLTALYWYHPLVWLSFVLMGQDMEMSCDEAVVRQLGTDIKKPYSQSLLHFAAGRLINSSTPLAFGENGVKRRIKNILSYKTIGKWIGIVGILVVSAAGALLLTTRRSPADSSPQNPQKRIDNNVISLNAEREVYEEYEAPDGQLYQVTKEGIVEVHADGDRLFFMTPSSSDSEKSISYTGIGWINPKSGAAGTIHFLPENPLSEFWLDLGYLQYRTEGETEFSSERHIFILPDEEEPTPAQLQKEAPDLSRQLTEHPGTLVSVGYHTLQSINTRLDLDMDGTAEEISLTRDTDVDEAYGYVPLDYYILQAGESVQKGHGDNMTADLYAVSLDGRTIQLVMCEEGPSADPISHVFSYQSGQLAEIGAIRDDIRLREITEDGEIMSHIFYPGIQDDYRLVKWHLNESRELEEIAQDTYELTTHNDLRLLTILPVFSMPVPSDGIYAGIYGYPIEPQTVQFTAVSSDGSWIQVEAQDGTQGWFHIEPSDDSTWNYVVSDLELGADQVFEGLNIIAG